MSYGEIQKRYFGRIKYKAKIKKLDINVTPEYLWDLFLKQDKRCAYSGQILYFSSNLRKDSKSQTASLDRIDPNKGYIIENVHWIHKDINFMKQSMTEEEFLKTCKDIYNFRIKNGKSNELG